MYKLVAKILANGLKAILPNLISENQSTFVLGRLITNNITVAFETMHAISRKRKGKEGVMALKLDMSKAYNRVEWGCLERIMLKMGFANKWVSTIMQCISSVKYAIRINGVPHGHIAPTRGLRQGDPLSPYLFLFCVEGLSTLINKVSINGELTGVAACRIGPRISHLFFANDGLIFCRATTRECENLQRILEEYEGASGQQLNREKTSLFFSHNTPFDVQEEIKTRFGA